jgi:transposase
VHVPTKADEHRRQLHRELLTLTRDRVRVTNRIRGLSLTLRVRAAIGARFGSTMGRLRQWNGDALPAPVRTSREREWAHVELITQQMKAVVAERHDVVRQATNGMGEQARRLAHLRGIGEHSAWVFAAEFFAWRQLRSRREVGAVAGLVPRPHQSGFLDWQQGISKPGTDTCARWPSRSPGAGFVANSAMRSRSGIRPGSRAAGRARARSGSWPSRDGLFIYLWRYLDAAVVPAGAILGGTRGIPAP